LVNAVGLASVVAAVREERLLVKVPKSALMWIR